MKLPLILLCLALPYSSYSEKPNTLSQIGIGISIGGSQLNTQAFKAYTPSQIRHFSNNQLLLGMDAFARFNNCIIGISSNLAKGDKISNDSFSYALSGGTTALSWGYKVYQNKHWLCFPMISSGMSAYGIGIDQKIMPYQSEMVRYSNRRLHIHNIGIVSDIGVNVYHISQSKKKNNSQNLIGFKLGYMHGFKNSNYTYTGGSVTEGPRFGMRMLYLKIVIGRSQQKQFI